MKALLIKFLPVTNTRPARLSVSAEGNKPAFYTVDSFCTNHPKGFEYQAAIKYAQSLNWNHEFIIGQLPDGNHCAVIKG